MPETLKGLLKMSIFGIFDIFSVVLASVKMEKNVCTVVFRNIL